MVIKVGVGVYFRQFSPGDLEKEVYGKNQEKRSESEKERNDYLVGFPAGEGVLEKVMEDGPDKKCVNEYKYYKKY